jgi:RNA polymerase sigma-70 factor, ECF subfamily
VSQSFPESSGITRLIQCARDGDTEAAARLWENIYQQVKEISIRALAKESRPLTIAATDIAHEAYLKLSDAKDFPFENRAHLMATVARAIRRLLVDHSRSRSAAIGISKSLTKLRSRYPYKTISGPIWMRP